MLRGHRIRFGGGDIARTLINIDDDPLRETREVLGAGTKKATVDEALSRAVRTHDAHEDVRRLREGMARDLEDPTVAVGAQR
ncbi:MAG: type II toxin-antitoxin system VapB family antitoxin [Bifidobacteriaceae bacterium]|jgi:Arc/MetJ family transcription regulator|nr:type II toxin-antitoxin system VapB family antitoxin [Bifidobacteriaceae bacterium]